MFGSWGGVAIGTRQALFDSPGKAFVGIRLDQPGFHGMGFLLLFLCGFMYRVTEAVCGAIHQSKPGRLLHASWLEIFFYWKMVIWKDTPCKINMEHKNGGFRFDDFPLQMGEFLGSSRSFSVVGISFQLWRFFVYQFDLFVKSPQKSRPFGVVENLQVLLSGGGEELASFLE